MTSGMSKQEYKEYFEQNNFRGNNYETAVFIKFLMEKKSKGKEIEQFTGMKHSQITSYKKIISSGRMEELKDNSISKVLKSIGKLNKKVISEFEKLSNEIPDKFMLGEDSDDGLYDSDEDGDEREAWEEEIRKITMKKSNNNTENIIYFLTEVIDENKILRRRISQDSEIRAENERLRKENASLLAYKKFFEEMKGKIESVQN